MSAIHGPRTRAPAVHRTALDLDRVPTQQPAARQTREMGLFGACKPSTATVGSARSVSSADELLLSVRRLHDRVVTAAAMDLARLAGRISVGLLADGNLAPPECVLDRRALETVELVGGAPAAARVLPGKPALINSVKIGARV